MEIAIYYRTILFQRWLKTRALSQGSVAWENQSTHAVFTILCYGKNKASWLAVSAPVAHGGNPLWPRWQVFRSAPLDRKEVWPRRQVLCFACPRS